MEIKMKEILEKLWTEYLAEECAQMDTDEEIKLTEKTGSLHEKVNALLGKEEREALEKYVDAIYDMEALFVKKAFFKGCEFTLSFLLEAGSFGD